LHQKVLLRVSCALFPLHSSSTTSQLLSKQPNQSPNHHQPTLHNHSTCLDSPTSDLAASTRRVTRYDRHTTNALHPVNGLTTCSAPRATPSSRPNRRPTVSTRARRTLTWPTTPVRHNPRTTHPREWELIHNPEDERSIANQLERESKREKEPSPEAPEVTESKKDATLPVCSTYRIKQFLLHPLTTS
jgi:hypothetical protein